MSVISGLNLYIADKVANLGANSFWSTSLELSRISMTLPRRRSGPLMTSDDYRALDQNMRLADRVAAADQTTLDVRGGGQLFET